MKEALKNYVNRCRCCLEQFADNENITPITDFFEIQFYAFTQLELQNSELLSNHVCEFCHSELLRFSVFKKDLIEKQLKLYGLLKQHNRKIENEINNPNSSNEEYKKESENEDEVGECEEDEPMEEEEEEESDPLETEYESSDSADNDSDYVINGRRRRRRHTKSKSPAIPVAVDREFRCDTCNMTFKGKQGLVRHVQSHSTTEVCNWKCNFCEYSASSKNKLNLHKTRYHNKVMKSKSPVKVLEDEKINNSSADIRNTGGGGRFQCFCGTSFHNRRSLQSHRSRRHGSINKCNFGCGVMFKTTGEWIRHIRENHKTYEAECLKMVTASKNNEWFTEIKSEDGGVNLQCGKCNFEAGDESSLSNHIKTNHENSEIVRKVECTDCFKLFANNTSLRMHIRTVHLDIRQFNCMYCKSNFKQLVHLKEHMLGVHKTLYKPYCCWCGLSFSTLASIKQHKLQMHKENKRNASVKEVKTATPPPPPPPAPAVHQNPPSSERKLICSCDKQFQYPSRLIAHQQSCRVFKEIDAAVRASRSSKSVFDYREDEDEDEDDIDIDEEANKPMFKCRVCSREFAHKSNMVRHQKVKGHLKPFDQERLKFTCKDCGDKFFNQRSMNYHKKTKPNCGSK